MGQVASAEVNGQMMFWIQTPLRTDRHLPSTFLNTSLILAGAKCLSL